MRSPYLAVGGRELCTVGDLALACDATVWGYTVRLSRAEEVGRLIG